MLVRLRGRRELVGGKAVPRGPSTVMMRVLMLMLTERVLVRGVRKYVDRGAGGLLVGIEQRRTPFRDGELLLAVDVLHFGGRSAVDVVVSRSLRRRCR